MNRTARRAWRSRTAKRCAVVIGYAALSLWSTWPLARAPLTTLPLGTMQAATVPLFNLWTIWWNADRLPHAFRGYWNAPIFHPTDDTFAFSEPQPATIVVAPLVWLTESPALAFNVYLWVALVLNGIFTERLLRTVGAGSLVAMGGGVLMLLLPIVHWQLDVLQLVPLWGILWTWTALVSVSRRPSLKNGAAVGVAFAVAFWACAHQALLLAVLLPGTVWFLVRRWRDPAIWLAGLTAVTVAAALVFPIVARMHHVIARHNFSRTVELVTQLSAQLGDYTAVPGKLLVDFGDIGARPFWLLSPGWVKFGLAAVGVVFGMTRRRWRRWTTFLLMTAVLACLLSLGTNLHIGSWDPWWTLTKIWPGLSQVRNVFRFAFFVQMAVVLLAAQAVHGLFLLNRRFCLCRWRRGLAGCGISLLGFLALAETRPDRPNIATVPDAAAEAAWINFVRRNTPVGQGIACLPFAARNAVEDFEVTARWMYYGTFHHVPLIDGYSGFFPREYFELRDAVNTSLLTAPTLERLMDVKTEFLVVRRAEYPAPLPRDAVFGPVRIERVFEDSAGVDVYRLTKEPPAQ